MHDNAYAHDLQVLNACMTPGCYTNLEIPSKEATRAAVKSKETKEVELVPGDKSKTGCIRATLDPK
jgi:hypothetical protein